MISSLFVDRFFIIMNSNEYKTKAKNCAKCNLGRLPEKWGPLFRINKARKQRVRPLIDFQTPTLEQDMINLHRILL
jgi:hypothetical protein